MINKSTTALLGSICLLGMSGQAFAAGTFTVDPSSIPGNAQSTFLGTSIAGTTAGRIIIDANTQTATETGWVQLNSFSNGPTLTHVPNGFGSSYQLYLEFNIASSLKTGTFGANGSSYNIDALSFTMFADPSADTVFTDSTLLTDASLSSATNDRIELATGNLLTGTATINDGGIALNSITDFVLTTPEGFDYFIDPDPFFILASNAFNNTAFGVDADFNLASGCTTTSGINSDGICSISANTGSATIDFDNPADVPEPATIALLGLSLLGFGAAKRRK